MAFSDNFYTLFSLLNSDFLCFRKICVKKPKDKSDIISMPIRVMYKCLSTSMVSALYDKYTFAINSIHMNAGKSKWISLNLYHMITHTNTNTNAT